MKEMKMINDMHKWIMIEKNRKLFNNLVEQFMKMDNENLVYMAEQIAAEKMGLC